MGESRGDPPLLGARARREAANPNPVPHLRRRTVHAELRIGELGALEVVPDRRGAPGFKFLLGAAKHPKNVRWHVQATDFDGPWCAPVPTIGDPVTDPIVVLSSAIKLCVRCRRGNYGRPIVWLRKHVPDGWVSSTAVELIPGDTLKWLGEDRQVLSRRATYHGQIVSDYPLQLSRPTLHFDLGGSEVSFRVDDWILRRPGG